MVSWLRRNSLRAARRSIRTFAAQESSTARWAFCIMKSVAPQARTVKRPLGSVNAPAKASAFRWKDACSFPACRISFALSSCDSATGRNTNSMIQTSRASMVR